MAKCHHCNGSGQEPVYVPPRVYTFQTAAAEIRKAAQELRESARSTWPGEPDMQRMYIEDARDMREVAKFLRTGDAIKARERAGNMDTAAREKIPQGPWDFMCEHADQAYRDRQSATTGS